MHFTWKKCLQTYQCDEKALKVTEQRYGRNSQRFKYMSQMLTKTLISDRAMVELIKDLMQDESLGDLYRHTSHKCLHLSNSQYMIYVQSRGEDNFGISIVFASYSINFEQAIALIKVYLSWSKNSQHNVLSPCFFDILDKIGNHQGELSHNKFWRNSRFEVMPRDLSEVRKVVLSTIQKIYTKVGKEFDFNNIPISEKPSENLLFQIWQMLKESHPFELELMQNGNVSEFTADIFARDLDKMRELANEAIKTIRQQEFEQFEILKDEDHD